ncbi:adenosylcobinamide-GDP ribazoletransferase [Variovorax ginsengisoli]|uniref:Adenosylcobinamide-GDP ribazoletransferase n=1 Tax=Variovorax ginsengisoli TaxID=363844 RepID=A0ABT8S6L2_9BURK|nr:adenosylcobinamide-GDP ribazoletransferase [Variovorax ginsengisoli]MDN8615386.1 adenosylcobinamide-GDP ribazoletransferase [Variovorax ginsengisoli]MDO1534556.1 adenosylcobinamide-GDP ribazoletransferase [Variovorax ginsengisoli]
MNGVRHFLLALQFFTRVPVTGPLAGWVGFSPAMLRASAAHFPGVGWLVGAVAAGVFCIAQAGLPGFAGALAAAALSTIATVLMTGAFHEDGLADVADGLGGSADRARALEIMKDSRIGAFGAIALVLALGLKVLLLGALAGQGVPTVVLALVSAHVLSRLAPLFLIRWLPYVGDENAASKSKPLADAIGNGALLVGVAWSLPAMGWLVMTQGAMRGLAPVLLCALAAWLVARLLRRRLRGFTGDGLGATQQVCELAIYLALAWRA